MRRSHGTRADTTTSDAGTTFLSMSFSTAAAFQPPAVPSIPRGDICRCGEPPVQIARKARGYSGRRASAAWRHAPENSLVSIRSASSNRIPIVEIEVQRTADGELILMHDTTVNRTTNGTGASRADTVRAAHV